MRYKAIIFDLFGTLVDNFTKQEYDKVYEAMCAELGAPYEAFRNAFGHSFSDRCKGKFQSIEEDIANSCREIGLQPTDLQIQSAAQHRYQFTIKTLHPQSEVLNTLSQLKKVGYQVGLITDCGPDLPLHWPTTPLATHIDEPLFSCDEKIKKPNQEIYRRAWERLNCLPDECVYVGDGGSQELTGAKEAGFLPILKRIDLEEIYDSRPDVVDWDGLAISEIDELPRLLEELENKI